MCKMIETEYNGWNYFIDFLFPPFTRLIGHHETRVGEKNLRVKDGRLWGKFEYNCSNIHPPNSAKKKNNIHPPLYVSYETQSQ